LRPEIARKRTSPSHVAVRKAQAPASVTELDTRDTTILKGLAISAIVLHNFFHLLSPARENEFVFHQGGLGVFLRTVQHPSLALQAFFSFFGYLGVSVFIFLSAYGLAKSHWNGSESWAHFMAGRIRKLFPTFGLVVLPWMLVYAHQNGLHPFLHTILPQIAFMAVGLTPLVPGLGPPPVGPWWFIPFILEFYAVFFALRKTTRKFGWQGLIVLALMGVAVSMTVEPWLLRWGINVYLTPLGRMPSICLGIAAARYSFRFPRFVVPVAGGAILLGSTFNTLWRFTSPAAVVLLLWIYMEARIYIRECRPLEQIGRYSVLIFLLNTIVRDQFLPFATTPALQLVFAAVSALISLAIAATIQGFLIESPAIDSKMGTAEKAA